MGSPGALAAIARRRGAKVTGAWYCCRGEPEHLGRELWQAYHDDFRGDLPALLKFYVRRPDLDEARALEVGVDYLYVLSAGAAGPEMEVLARSDGGWVRLYTLALEGVEPAWDRLREQLVVEGHGDRTLEGIADRKAGRDAEDPGGGKRPGPASPLC